METFIELSLLNIALYIVAVVVLMSRVKSTVLEMASTDDFIRTKLDECGGRTIRLLMGLDGPTIKNYKKLQAYKISLISIILVTWALGVVVLIVAN